MLISGFLKNSLIDYPGKIASVIFTQGCNMRCKFCHNHELIPMSCSADTFSEEEVFAYLQKAKKFIDALVITGGEPTLQVDLESFIRKVKQLGMSVKLDTNGSNPELLKRLLDENLIDYVAMDVKHKIELHPYQLLVGNQFSEKQLNKLKESICILKTSNIEVEFRTTLIREIHSCEDIHAICKYLQSSKLYSLQEFSSNHVFDKSFSVHSAYSKKQMNNLMLDNQDIMPNMRVL